MTEERTFAAHDAGLLRRNRSYLAMGASPIGVALATILGAIATGSVGFLAATPHLLLLGILSLAYVVQQNPAPVRASGGIRVTEEGIWAEGQLVARREDLKQGLVVPGGDEGVVVRLELRGRWLPLSIGVLDAATGERLLGELGLAAHQTAARVKIPSALTDWPLVKQLAATLLPPVGGLLVGLLGTVLTGSPIPLVVCLVPMVLLTMFLAVARRSLDIGSEGLRFRWLGRETFVRFADVQEMEAADRTRGGKEFRVLRIEDRSGAAREIVLSQKGWDGGLSGAIEERVRAAFEAYQRRGDSGEEGTSAPLARRARDVRVWITSLKRMGAGVGVGPRDAALPRDSLLAIVEDPSRADLDRAAAAIALGEGAGEGDRARVRIAARSSASPRLRIALERAADAEAEQGAIEEALEAVEQDAAAATKTG